MLETPGSQMIPTTSFGDRNTEETQTLQPQRQLVVITRFENCRIQNRVGEPTRLETCPFLDVVIGRSSAKQIFNPPQKLEVEGLLSIARPALPSTCDAHPPCPPTLDVEIAMEIHIALELRGEHWANGHIGPSKGSTEGETISSRPGTFCERYPNEIIHKSKSQ